MRVETYGVTIEKFVRFKPKLYMFLVDDNSEHKNAMVVNRNIFKKVNSNEYKEVLLNKKCMSMKDSQ